MNFYYNFEENYKLIFLTAYKTLNIQVNLLKPAPIC
jgi:hypothetical protein